MFTARKIPSDIAKKNISENSHLRAIQIKTYVGKYPYIYVYCQKDQLPSDITKKKIYRRIVIYIQDTKQ